MPQTISRRGALLRIKVQHREQELGEGDRLGLRPLVLLGEDFVQRPRLQLGDVTQLA